MSKWIDFTDFCEPQEVGNRSSCTAPSVLPFVSSFSVRSCWIRFWSMLCSLSSCVERRNLDCEIFCAFWNPFRSLEVQLVSTANPNIETKKIMCVEWCQWRKWSRPSPICRLIPITRSRIVRPFQNIDFNLIFDWFCSTSIFFLRIKKSRDRNLIETKSISQQLAGPFSFWRSSKLWLICVRTDELLKSVSRYQVMMPISFFRNLFKVQVVMLCYW